MTKINNCAIGAVLLWLFACAPGWAQFKRTSPEKPQAPVPLQQPPSFSVHVNLVRLLVSVRDRSGAVITDLNKDDFHVLDSGVPQKISVFERKTSVPLSVAILLDTSGSTQIDLHYEVGSVSKFIPTLLNAGNPEDTFALYSFNWRINLECDYSRNQHRAEQMLRNMRGEGGTSLYDAIYLASDGIADREGRHVMILVTDGDDTTSYKQYDDALRAAQRSDSILYPIVVVPIENDAGRNIGGEHALAALAASTGGRIFYPASYSQLDQAFAQILRELRTQYLLGFYPQSVEREPGFYHSIKVELHDPSLKVSVRSGYYEP